MPTFASLVETGAPIDAIAAHLDALAPDARLAECRALPAKAQQRLFELARGRGCTIDGDFTPGTGPLAEVVHEGRNSLPAFRRFQKRFARLPGDAPIASGYNHQSLMPLTGPGYYVAREAELDGTPTVVIDYTLLPDLRAASWPPIAPNSVRLGPLVYEGMQDWMWRVCAHVTIGRARKARGWLDNWFVLCRS